MKFEDLEEFLNNLVLLESLGEGAFGKVIKAYSKKT